MSRRAQGQGSLFPWKRRDRVTGEMVQVGWTAMLDLGIVDGKRRRKAISGKTQREVITRLNEALRDHQRGQLPAAGRLTVAQHLDRWLQSVEGSVRPRTLAHYRWLVEKHLTPALGRKQLVQVTPIDVEAMLAAKRRAGLSPRTCSHLRAALRNALRLAEREGSVHRNVAALARAPKLEQRELRTLDPAEVKRFLGACATDRMGPLYVVTLGLGLRQGEALGLRWEDVDFEAGTVRITVALQRLKAPAQKPGETGRPRADVRLVEPKSKSSRRTMPLPAPVAAALREQRQRQLEEQLSGRVWLDQWGLVFTTHLGTPLDSTAALRGLWKVLESAGLPRMRFHDLRHSCATLLLAQGVPIKVISEVLGHSSTHLTESTYLHTTTGLRQQATDAMTGILGG